MKSLFMLSMVLAMILSMPIDLKFYFDQDPRCDELIEITVTETLTGADGWPVPHIFGMCMGKHLG